MTAPMDTPDTAAQVAREIAAERADWLVDAVAGATQDTKLLRGEPDEDEVLTEAILLSGQKAIEVAIARYAAFRAQSDPAATQGLVQVPRDPTPKMVEAMQGVMLRTDMTIPSRLSLAFAAAVEVAPKAAATQGLDAVRREALEEAAKIADADTPLTECPYGNDKPGDPTWGHTDDDICPVCHKTGHDSLHACLDNAKSRIAKRIRALIDKAPSPLPADAEGERRGWQDIATAPKDGDEVDLWIAPLSPDGRPLTPCRVPNAHFHCGEWLVWGGDPEIGWTRLEHRITHWMRRPLPPPPESSGEQPAAPAAGGA